ncbi:DinB family protein [Longimicrobium terrae]|uniref:Putative damage-inducible protein DinB n=1 Tax=Longimicrobium terrae TaxID=1639882 RepID=A0A841GWK0_9BACT|nr:DinB family protein [Longimicrobium terrae]MBB4635689.1 putative damage-inducible protein DinB [Longimicrobium terrae]MBB6070083.1 putative damage-inducible protein DinB [Longimicrobium terrae]NNC32986.1 DinB family protein [Longimicrobium terrae]
MTPKMQEIAGELDKARRGLLAAVQGLSQAELDARPKPDSWSVGEVMHHVSKIESGMIGMLSKLALPAIADGLPKDPAPEQSVLSMVEHLPVLDRTQRITAPEFVRPTHGISREELEAGLARTRGELLAAMEQADGYDLSGLSRPHPRFGPLNLYQWLALSARHEQRHTAQIAEAREALAAGAN